MNPGGLAVRRQLGALITAVALATSAACSSSDATQTSTPEQADKVSAGMIAIVDVAPIYLGKQKGFFRERNIDLSLSTSQGGAAIVPGVVSGQFQIGYSGVTSLLLAASKGLPIKMVCHGAASTGEAGRDVSGVVVKADSPVRTAADLGGRTVALNTLQNLGDTTVRASVRQAGGDPKAVKFVELPFPDMPAALQAGRVDAIWAVEPFLTSAVGQGGRVVAWPYVDTAPDLTLATYFASKELTASNPDLMRRFTEAMTESLRYADTHPEEARQVVATYTQIPPDVLAKLTLPKWPSEINRESVQTLADLAVEDGLITNPPDVNALLP
jgi:NitT/TauT family transport system substrate-binding protein